MQVHVGPRVNRRASGWALLPVAAASTIVGYFAIGPSSILVMGITVVAVVVLLVSGPRINDRIYGGPRSPGLSLSSSALMDRKAGRLELGTGRLVWTPRGRQSSFRSIVVELQGVSKVELRPVDGIPLSCQLSCQMRDGSSLNLTVFRKCSELVEALERAAEG